MPLTSRRAWPSGRCTWRGAVARVRAKRTSTWSLLALGLALALSSLISPSPPACCSRGRSAPCCRPRSSRRIGSSKGELPPPWRVRGVAAADPRTGPVVGRPAGAGPDAAVVRLGRRRDARRALPRLHPPSQRRTRPRRRRRCRSIPWWFYGPQFVADFLPWSLLLPVAGCVCWRRGYWRTDPEVRLGLALVSGGDAGAVVRRLQAGDYLLPAYPGAALFLGCVFANEERRWREARPRAVWAGLCLLPCLLAVGMTAGWLVHVERGLPAEEAFRDYRRFAAEVRRQAPPPRRGACSSARRPTPWRFTWADRWPSW